MTILFQENKDWNINLGWSFAWTSLKFLTETAAQEWKKIYWAKVKNAECAEHKENKYHLLNHMNDLKFCHTR